MKIKTLAQLSAAAAALVMAGAAAAQTPAAGKPEFGAFGVDLTAENHAVKPGDDFWSYANGTWDQATQIAADRTQAGPFVTLADRSEEQVHQILTNLAANPDQYGASGK